MRPDGIRGVWLIAAIAVLATVVLAVGVLVGVRLDGSQTAPPAALPSPATAPSPSAPNPGTITPSLAAEFAQWETKLDAVAGIAVSAIGAGQTPMTLGDWQSGPAWSTIKVPLIIAALREENPPVVTDAMNAAITESDNAAAESIWAGLGDPATAAQKVDAVLRETGDPTMVQSQRVRPEFTAFGQTEWALADQVRFIANAQCDKANDPIFALMGRIEPDQSWGIGTVTGSRFKGGWGPSPTGAYLVRQMGVMAAPGGLVAVTLAAQPASGRFDDGTADLTEMAAWLSAHLGALPAGQCAP